MIRFYSITQVTDVKGVVNTEPIVAGYVNAYCTYRIHMAKTYLLKWKQGSSGDFPSLYAMMALKVNFEMLLYCKNAGIRHWNKDYICDR